MDAGNCWAGEMECGAALWQMVVHLAFTSRWPPSPVPPYPPTLAPELLRAQVILRPAHHHWHRGAAGERFLLQ